MKNILTLVHDDAGQEARLQISLDLVRAVGGHLTCVDVVPFPIFAADYVGVAGSAALLSSERERESANGTRLKGRLSREDVPYDWIDADGDPSVCLRDAASLADLIVVNRKIADLTYPDMQEIVGELILKSAKPVMAVPAEARGLDPRGPVIVAWNGSDVAEAAMRAAVPLLALSSSITILEVDHGHGGRTPANEAAQYLSRHGIHVDVRHEQGKPGEAAALIGAGIAELHPAYVVMGGFGHARWRETLFGGVTRRMLEEAAVPVFFGH